MTVPDAPTLYFELAPYSRSDRLFWEQTLARWQAESAAGVRLAAKPDEADCIVETSVRQNFTGGRVFTVAPDSHYHRRPADTFAWDGQDQPTGRLPGLYCSLSRRIFDATRHRTFRYPHRYNEFVALAPLHEARHLFGFTGSVTSPLRARLFDRLAPAARTGRALLRATAGIWGQIFTAGSAAAKESYLADLRACKFVLCPRGNGTGSVRLFEALETGRVPVILSDNYVAPPELAAEPCVVRIRERDLNELPAILAAKEADWPALAARARSVWENCFSDRVVLSRIAAGLTAIRAARRTDERWMPLLFPPRVLPHLAVCKLKQLSVRFRSAGKPRPAPAPAIP